MTTFAFTTRTMTISMVLLTGQKLHYRYSSIITVESIYIPCIVNYYMLVTMVAVGFYVNRVIQLCSVAIAVIKYRHSNNII